MTEERHLDADKIFGLIQEAGEDWADKKAAYHAYDDITKTNLADIKSNYLGSCKSRAEAEDMALASRDFKEHLARLAAARKAWLLSQVKFENLKLLAELRRSEESTRRAELSLR